MSLALGTPARVLPSRKARPGPVTRTAAARAAHAAPLTDPSAAPVGPFKALQSWPEWATLAPHQQARAKRVCGAYALRAVSDRDAHTAMRLVVPDFRLSEVHDMVSGNGILLRDLKCEWFATYAGSAVNEPQFQDEISNLLRSTVCNRYMDSLLDAGLIPLPPEEIDRRVGDALGSDDLRTYMAKFIHRKMQFILETGVEEHAIVSDLKQSAVFYLLKMYPKWKSSDELLMMSKDAVKKRGHNYIKYFTAARRKKAAHGDVFELSLDSSEQFRLYVENKMSCGLTGSTESQEHLDRIESLHALLSKPGSLSRTSFSYVRLLLGVHDPLFTVYLGGPNDQLLETMPFNAYEAKVMSFLGISKEEIPYIRKELAKHL